MALRFAAVYPVLPSRDVAASLAFYTECLGFMVLFQDDDAAPHYAGIGRDAVALHLQWHDPDEWDRVERPMLRFAVEDIEALFEAYRAQGVFHVATTLRDTAWGTREFAFFDPDQNGLTFFRDLTEAERASPTRR